MSEHVRIWHLWALDTLLQDEVSCHTANSEGPASPVMLRYPLLFPKCQGVYTSKSPSPGCQLAVSPQPHRLSALLIGTSGGQVRPGPSWAQPPSLDSPWGGVGQCPDPAQGFHYGDAG